MNRDLRGISIEKDGLVSYVLAPSARLAPSALSPVAYAKISRIVWLPRLNVVTVGKYAGPSSCGYEELC